MRRVQDDLSFTCGLKEKTRSNRQTTESSVPSVYKAAALSTKKLREEGAQQENRELLETMNNMLSQELHKVSFCLVQLGLKRLQVVNFVNFG